MSLKFIPASEGLAPEPDRYASHPHPREMLSLIGHRAAEQEVLGALRSGRMHHAWLIAGEEGIGKATFAYRVARFILAGSEKPGWLDAETLDVEAVNTVAHQIAAGGHPDLSVIRRVPNQTGKTFYTEIRADDARKGLDVFNKTAAFGGYRIVIVDCCDEMNAHSANSLLKTLEEPPDKSLFLLVVHRPGATLPTIRSRCRMLHLEPLSETEIVAGLRAFPDINASDEDIGEAARNSNGSLRRALALLDGRRRDFVKRVREALNALPQADYAVVDAIAESTTGRAGDESFEQFVSLAEVFMSEHLKKAGGNAFAIAEAWIEMTDRRRAVDGLNLDRRPFVIGTFERLEKALRR